MLQFTQEVSFWNVRVFFASTNTLLTTLIKDALFEFVYCAHTLRVFILFLAPVNCHYSVRKVKTREGQILLGRLIVMVSGIFYCLRSGKPSIWKDARLTAALCTAPPRRKPHCPAASLVAVPFDAAADPDPPVNPAPSIDVCLTLTIGPEIYLPPKYSTLLPRLQKWYLIVLEICVRFFSCQASHPQALSIIST